MPDPKQAGRNAHPAGNLKCLKALAAQPFPDLFDDRVLVGELTGLKLRVDEFAIGRQFKASAAGRFKLEALDALLIVG